MGVPIWPLKMLIPAAGVLLTLQGIAEVLRCALCLQEGVWPPRMHDVEELEQLMQAHRRGPMQECGHELSAGPHGQAAAPLTACKRGAT